MKIVNGKIGKWEWRRGREREWEIEAGYFKQKKHK